MNPNDPESFIEFKRKVLIYWYIIAANKKEQQEEPGIGYFW